MNTKAKISKVSIKYKRKRKRMAKAGILALVTIIFLLILESILQINASNKNAQNTAKILMNQVSSVITEGEIKQANLIGEIKVEYMLRAQALAYVFDRVGAEKYNTDYLRERRSLSSVDEINIFDENGTIVSSTEPRYIGYNMNDGEQIGFFKPLLEDKSLTLCQDMTPNTASKKTMMYAASWNEEGTFIVQIGVEPKRLLSYIRESEVSKIVNDIPRYEGYYIYVADADTGIIKGATNTVVLGATLESIGYEIDKLKDGGKIDEFRQIDNKTVLCKFRQSGRYIIGIIGDMNIFYRNAFYSVLIVLVYLSIAAVLVLAILSRLFIANEDRESQLNILSSMSEIYYSLHYVDLESNTVLQYTGQELVEQEMQNTKGSNAVVMMRNIMEGSLTEEYMKEGLEFSDITTLAERMKGKKLLTRDLMSTNIGWFRMSFITIEAKEDGTPVTIVVATQNIDEEKKKEFELFEKSNKDALTLCQSRRVYEEEIAAHNNIPAEDDFTVIVFDMNGVKRINDNLGHDAGDEAIRAAAEIMRNTYGKYGVVYRMGGDEFTSIVFTDTERLKRVTKEFEEKVASWHGKKVDSISISYGIATKKEFPDLTVTELIKKADEKMYQTKRAYYETKGIDRRRSS